MPVDLAARLGHELILHGAKHRPATAGVPWGASASLAGVVPTPAYHRPPMKETPIEPRAGEALVWTDGACSGNPGPGGWAAIVIPPSGGDPLELSGGDPHTTNNRMELTAAL